MSRRKQFKPRHLDADEEGESVGPPKILETVSNNAESPVNNDIKESTPERAINPDMDERPVNGQSPCPDVDMPKLYRQDSEKYFPSPNQRFSLLNRSTSEPKRAVVSPLPRQSREPQDLSQQLVAATITPEEMERRYFQSIAASVNASLDAKNNMQYSDDEDDVPSDIESCANESELQEEIEKQSESASVGDTPSAYRNNNSVDDKKVDNKEDKLSKDGETGNNDEENSSKFDTNANTNNSSVKLKALETTNVAVAQVVENNNNPEMKEHLPNLQQVLFTLHQQQMFQLHVLQQIQHQVTKIAHTDEDPTNPKDEATAALFGMMGRGMTSLQSTGSDDSCGVDDAVSEGSISNDENMADHCDDDLQHNLSSSPLDDHRKGDDLDHALQHDFVTPSASPELSPRDTPSKTPSSIDGDFRRLPFPENGDSFKDIPHGRPMPPLPYLGGLNGHMMPGNINPLLPSNMFNPNSGMYGPSGMPGRFPMFRSPVVPRPEEDDPLEEFMEIDTSDSTKLEEFMKKVEPTLKDPNQCAVCKKVLSCKSALQMHYRTHTGSRPFKCKICGRAFTTKGNLKTHMSVHRSRPSGPSLHQCPVCSKKFSSVMHVQEHMRMHLGEIHSHSMPKHPLMPMLPQGFMPFMGGCPILPPALPQEKRPDMNGSLNLSSKESKELNSSFERKSPVNNSVEPIKRPPVDSVEELRQKRQKIDIIEPPKFEIERPYLVTPEKPVKPDMGENTSPDTVNPFTASASLMALEEMDKKITASNFFVKSEDPKLFNVTDKMIDNLQLQKDVNSSESQKDEGNKGEQHLKMEPVQTSVITQAPSSQSTKPTSNGPVSLPANRSVSNSQSPPSCPTSPFNSSRRQTLRHVCSVCHKPFSSSSALQIHMRTHTGERPFKCNVCDKAFTTKGNLKVHMSTHAIVSGPPRRGRRMSMDNIPPFANPGQFPPLAPRPPLPMFPGFPYGNMFVPGKGLSLPPVGILPGHLPISPLAPRRDGDDNKESSLSPTEVMDLHKASDSSDNNNGPSKGIHGELDLSIRAPSQHAIKT